jgi:hypothetical protein
MPHFDEFRFDEAYFEGVSAVTLTGRVTAKDALQIARSLLNDDLGTKWPDSVLFPRLQIAHRQMQAALLLNSIPVIKSKSAIILVPAFSTVLGVYQPTDLIEPISMKERDPGGSMDDFDDMTEVAFIPELEQDTNLIYWSWIGEGIKFLGATVDKEVLLRYTSSLALPQTVNDSIFFLGGEIYLGYKIASMCSRDVVTFYNEAEKALEILIRTNVKGMQGIAHRRLPYRHRGRR